MALRSALLFLSVFACAMIFMVASPEEASAQAYTTVDHAIDVAGLPPVFHTIAYLESGDNPYAVNDISGACGPFQFLPSTAYSMGYTCWDLQDPYVAAYAARELYYLEGLSPWAASIG